MRHFVARGRTHSQQYEFFAMLYSRDGTLKYRDIISVSLTVASGFNKRLKENMKCIEKLKDLWKNKRPIIKSYVN